MVRKASASASAGTRHDARLRSDVSPAQREQMIREAAYYRYVRRGFVPGHDLDDWLAAEAQLFSAPGGQEPAERLDTEAPELQQSGAHGAWRDDAIKRIVRQHPQEGIPRVESVEAREAPPKE